MPAKKPIMRRRADMDVLHDVRILDTGKPYNKVAITTRMKRLFPSLAGTDFPDSVGRIALSKHLNPAEKRWQLIELIHTVQKFPIISAEDIAKLRATNRNLEDQWFRLTKPPQQKKKPLTSLSHEVFQLQIIIIYISLFHFVPLRFGQGI